MIISVRNYDYPGLNYDYPDLNYDYPGLNYDYPGLNYDFYLNLLFLLGIKTILVDNLLTLYFLSGFPNLSGDVARPVLGLSRLDSSARKPPPNRPRLDVAAPRPNGAYALASRRRSA